MLRRRADGGRRGRSARAGTAADFVWQQVGPKVESTPVFARPATGCESLPARDRNAAPQLDLAA
jgi:hypothetical protein